MHAGGLIRAALLVSLAPLAALAQQAPGAAAAEGDGTPAPQATAPAAPVPTSPQDRAAGPAVSRGIVTVDQEKMYNRSAWGQRAEALVAERLRAVQAENDRLFADLSAEEADLTRQRATLPAEDFRARATAFDERVTTLRREREAASLEVAALAEAERNRFFAAAVPVIGSLMRERGAVLVLDPRTVLMSAEAIDMTDAAIARLNQQVGDGAGLVQVPPVPLSTPAPGVPPASPPATGHTELPAPTAPAPAGASRDQSAPAPAGATAGQSAAGESAPGGTAVGGTVAGGTVN